MGYVRFVVQRVDEDSCRRRGLFVALGVLSDSGDLFDHERERYRDCLAWFDAHLARPRRFARARRSHPRAIAISWFKPGATEHIGRMRAMAAILDAHGIHVEVVTSRRPGYVVYEDRHQIAAVPFADTRA